MVAKALVLGGGGVTGVAWELGVLAGLADAGIDLTSADLFVGTSAGSVVASMIASGADVHERYAAQLAGPDLPGPDLPGPDLPGQGPAGQGLAGPGLAGPGLAGPGKEIPAKLGAGLLARYAWAMARSRSSEQFGVRMGRLALAARTVPAAERREVIASRLGLGESWPATALKITAVDAATGEFVVFDRDSGVSLIDAVTASCAVPGVWPPADIRGRRYIDGGMRSAVNAELASGTRQIVVLAPIVRGAGPLTPPARQVAALRQEGAKVVLVSPDALALKAIGRNVLDPQRRRPAAQAGYAQASAEADAIARVWA